MSRGLRLGVWALCGALVIAGATAIRIDTDINRFILAGAADPQLRVAEALQRDAGGRTVLIALRAADTEAAARASRALAAALRASGVFAGAHNGDASQVLADAEFLVAHRYQLSDRVTPATFGEDALRTALQRAAAMLQDSRAWLVEQLLPRDPTLETLHVAEQWQGGARLPLRHGVWFTADGRALLLAVTRAAGDEAEGQQAAAEAIRAAAAPLQAADASLAVQYSGLGLLAAEARAATRTRVERLGVASALLVTLILWLGYRRPLPVVYSLLPVALGLSAGLLATFALFGDVNLLAIAFACILIDEGSDYPSYLLTQSRTGETVGAEAARIWPTLRLAVLTSAAAFAVLVFAQFRGLQQLAVLCCTGLLVAGGAARWLVPELLGPQRRVTWSPPRLTAAARLLATPSRAAQSARWARWLLPMAGVAAAVAVLAALPLWNDDVSAINPLPPQRIAQDRDLRAAAGLAADGTTLAFSGPDAESVLLAQEAWLPALRALREQGQLARYDLAARYLPSRHAQAARSAAIPPADALRERLQRAAQSTGFDAEAFAPFVAEASRAAAPLTPGDLPEGALRLRVSGLLLPVDGRWVGLVTLDGAASREALLASARQAAGDRGVDVAAFEPRQRLIDVLHAVRERLLMLLALCVTAVWAVIAVHHRSAALALRIMLPVATALLLTAALSRIALGPLTVFNVVALLLLLGVLTNYSLFVHAPPRDATAAGGVDRSYTVFSLLIASGTTLAVFGALAVSGIGVVESVGRTVVIGIIAGLAWIVATKPVAAASPRAEAPVP